jgi:hypothetical protein
VAAAAPLTAEPKTLRCRTCGRFRAYRDGDAFCIACGCETLSPQCDCGRAFDYALDEPAGGGLHCPRCGRDFRASETDWAFR